MITRQQAILIAKRCALRREREHSYLTHADDPDWMPHEWVVDAILVAAHLNNAALQDRLSLPCNLKQYSDSMQCTLCGLAWDITDPDPPPCPNFMRGHTRAD